MTNIDTSVKFVSINIALITISDSRSENEDQSGSFLNDRITTFGHTVKKKLIITDDVELIKQTFLDLSNDALIDVIISTGGTGLTGRDSTPEAVMAIANKTIDGFGELFRQLSFNKIATSAIQSRAIGAVVNDTYIFCLPGSINACKDAWDDILQFQLDIRYQPCNFIELMPRLTEK